MRYIQHAVHKYGTPAFKHGSKYRALIQADILIHAMAIMPIVCYITETRRVNEVANHIMCYKTDGSKNACCILLSTFSLDWPHHLPPKSSLAGCRGISHKLFDSRWICCNGSGRNAPAIKLIIVRHIIRHSCSRVH